MKILNPTMITGVHAMSMFIRCRNMICGATAMALTGLLTIAAGCDAFGGAVPVTPEGEALARQKEAAAALAAEASADFESLAAANSATAVDDLLAQLAARPGVVSAGLSSDGATIVVALNDGEVISLFTDEKHRAQWQASGAPRPIVPDARPASGAEPFDARSATRGKAAAAAQSLTPEEFIVCDPEAYPQSNKACIVMNFPFQFNQATDKIKTPLERAKFSVTTFRLQTFADVKALQDSLADCGVLYISTHGGVGETRTGIEANILATEIEIVQGAALPQQMSELLAIYNGGEVNEYLAPVGAAGRAYWGLTPSYFKTATYKNTFVFVDACQSDTPVAAGGDSLRAAFLERGAGAFLGWSDSISTKFSNPATEEIFEGLAPVDLAVQGVSISTNPSMPSAFESYVPTVQVQPPAAGIEVRLHIMGTDFFSRSETLLTDEFGEADFSSVPGASAGVTDTLTAVAGGADNGVTVVSAAKTNNPTLLESCQLAWQAGTVSIASLNFAVGPSTHAGFNIVCNNPEATTMTTFVKF